MKTAGLSFLVGISLVLSARADITITSRVEGMGPAAETTVKIKGDKALIEASPHMTILADGKTGEVIMLMKDQKRIVRLSADKMKAATEMIGKFTNDTKSSEKTKFASTGRKEMVNGFEAEEFVCDTPLFKASYWIAPKYPGGEAILKQLQTIKSEVWSSANSNMPDYHDLPGLPIKSVVTMGDMKITSTLVSVKQDALSEADFAVPTDFQDVKIPDFGRILQGDDRKP